MFLKYSNFTEDTFKRCNNKKIIGIFLWWANVQSCSEGVPGGLLYNWNIYHYSFDDSSDTRRRYRKKGNHFVLFVFFFVKYFQYGTNVNRSDSEKLCKTVYK